MRLEYDVTKKDLETEMRYYLDQIRPRTFFSFFFYFLFSIVATPAIMIIMATPFMVILRFGVRLYFPQEFFDLMLVVSLIISFLINAIFRNRWIRAKYTVNRMLKRGQIEKQYIGRHLLELGEHSIKMRYGTVSTERFYVNIPKIDEYPGGIRIFMGPTDRDIIPLSAFPNAESHRSFYSNLKDKLWAANSVVFVGESAREQAQPIQQTPEAAYVLEYTWNEPDFIDALVKANRLMYTTKLGWSKVQIALCIFTIAQISVIIYNVLYQFRHENLSGLLNQEFLSRLTPLIAFVIVLLSTLFLPLLSPWSKKTFTARIANGAIPSDYFDRQELLIRQDRLVELRGQASYEVMFANIHCIKLDTDNLYFLLKTRGIKIVPISAFKSQNELMEMIEFINSNK